MQIEINQLHGLGKPSAKLAKMYSGKKLLEELQMLEKKRQEADDQRWLMKLSYLPGDDREWDKISQDLLLT